ncbi:hypothetical protein J3R82DRAFT_10200, partial [Butyriboletus roseoflavus]
HIGPNILSEINDRIFTVEIGILTGNIVCLKNGSIIWWNGPDAECKHSNINQSSMSQSRSPAHQPQKRVAYEKKFHSGGGCCFTGPLMIAEDGSGDMSKDYELWYQSIDHSIWLSIPREFTVCENANDN